MIIRLARFNTYLFTLLLSSAIGCKTTEQRKQSKEASTIRLFLEVNPDASGRSGGVPIYRSNPTLVNVNRDPFLTEVDVQEAAIVDADYGFAIKIQFNRHGSLVLENTTTAYKGRRIAIQSDFTESRWLAAPIIRNRISNGVLVFTPDATREEAERIARGLNNIAREIRKRSRF
ncbi:MAG: hypothetical protein FJ403_11115 [Verrucomicrobia bacterium]|nr:hypothetical protein [Verrucomicrobiota bacterium]